MVDIQWSPSDSCVFAAVTRDGRLQLWNLGRSTLDPCLEFKCDTVSRSGSSPWVFSDSGENFCNDYRVPFVAALIHKANFIPPGMRVFWKTLVRFFGNSLR